MAKMLYADCRNDDVRVGGRKCNFLAGKYLMAIESVYIRSSHEYEKNVHDRWNIKVYIVVVQHEIHFLVSIGI